MAAWTPSSRTLAILLVVSLFLGSLGFVWVGSIGEQAVREPESRDWQQTPSSQVGDEQVGQGGPLPASPELTFDPPTADGVARLDGQEYESLASAVSRADPGDTVLATGRFREPVHIDTPGITITSTPESWLLIDGRGDEPALEVRASNVTIRHLWIDGAAANVSGPDPAVRVLETNLTLETARLTKVDVGLRGERAHRLRVENVTISGGPNARDGISLWRTDDPVVTDSRFTRLRDAVHYAWVSGGRTVDTVAWDVRYSLSVLYSTNHVIRRNRYFNNDVGIVLLHSKRLDIAANWIVNNTGQSGHGVLLNALTNGSIRNNTILSNGDGLYIDNSVGNRIVENNISFNGQGVVLDAEQNVLAENVIARNRFGVIVVKPVSDSVLERVSQRNRFGDNERPIFRSEW
jgi:nitrous oxidase accessory protein